MILFDLYDVFGLESNIPTGQHRYTISISQKRPSDLWWIRSFNQLKFKVKVTRYLFQ